MTTDPEARRLTRATLRDDLYRCLKSAPVRLRAGPLSDSKARADFEWKHARRNGQRPDTADIVIDIHRDGAIRLVVHELLHFHLYWELGRWGNMEETIAEAVENDLTEMIEGSPSQLMRWRLAIQAKLSEDRSE